MTVRSSPSPRRRQIRLGSLRKDVPTEFEFVPEVAEAEDMKARLDLLGLRKVRLKGQLSAEARGEWHLSAHLGATIVQPCSLTLDPVTTRIEERVTRIYSDSFVAPSDGEGEMPEDDTMEPLPETVDLADLAEEALALALPAFPRAADATDEAPLEVTAAPPGAAPLTDEEARPSPFAALADLKSKLED